MRIVVNVSRNIRSPRLIALAARGYLRGVVACNRVLLRQAKASGQPLPRLYDSGVRWRREPWAGRFEEFADIETVLSRGWGDCDDLAAWRIAELQEAGVPADFLIKWRVDHQGRAKMYHAMVRVRPRLDPKTKRITGPIEDPSIRLGMNER